jgi:hypothetical protein
MSRTGVAVTCVVVSIVGFVVGRATGRGSAGTVTVVQTVDRSVVVSAQHVGSADDPRDPGPLDLARVSSVRRGAMLDTTIVTHRAWRDSLLRGGRVGLSILYDTNGDGRPDRRDVVFLLRGRLASWISSLGQGVQAAPVTRRSPTTISISRDATVFYNGPRQASLLWASAIRVAVVARWKGGGDRVPDRGWITIPPPPAG